MRGILVFAVRADAVRRAVHQEGIRPGIFRERTLLGHIDRREKPLSIPHGNAVLVLRVMRLHKALLRRIGLQLRAEPRRRR